MSTRVRIALIVFGWLWLVGNTTTVFAAAGQIEESSGLEWREPIACMKVHREFETMCMSHLFRVAQDHEAVKDHAQAIMRYTQILRMQPFADVYAQRGMSYINSGDPVRGRRDFVRAIRMHPGLDDVWAALATVDLFRNKPRLALAHVNRAININPTAVYHIETRAKVYRALKLIARARADEKTVREAKARDAKTETSERAETFDQ